MAVLYGAERKLFVVGRWIHNQIWKIGFGGDKKSEEHWEDSCQALAVESLEPKRGKLQVLKDAACNFPCYTTVVLSDCRSHRRSRNCRDNMSN